MDGLTCDMIFDTIAVVVEILTEKSDMYLW